MYTVPPDPPPPPPPPPVLPEAGEPPAPPAPPIAWMIPAVELLPRLILLAKIRIGLRVPPNGIGVASRWRPSLGVVFGNVTGAAAGSRRSTADLGASTPALQGRPADHLASANPQQVSGDCSGCHTTTDWNSNLLPPGHMPNPGNQACAVCHTAIANTLASYATLASIAVLHTGISGGCAQCHGAATQLTFYNNNDNPKDGVLTP